jgi:hypothetical protein
MSLSRCLRNGSPDLLNASTQEGTIFELTQRYDLILFLWYRKNKNMSSDKTFWTRCMSISSYDRFWTVAQLGPAQVS